MKKLEGIEYFRTLPSEKLFKIQRMCSKYIKLGYTFMKNDTVLGDVQTVLKERAEYENNKTNRTES